MKRKVQEKLALTGHPRVLRLSVAGGATMGEKLEKQVTYQLMSLDEKFTSRTLIAVTTPKVASPIAPVTLDPTKVAWLKGITFTMTYPQKCETSLDLILNTNDTTMLQIGEVIQCPSDVGPRVIMTKLGAALCGAYLTNVQTAVFHVFAAKTVMEPFDETLFRDFMQLESIGITTLDSELTVDELEAIALMKKATSYDPVAKRYTTGMLWRKDPATHLDNNIQRALSVCRSFKRKTMKEPGLEEVINKAFRGQLDLGVARIIPRSEWYVNRPTYCIPSHPVFKPKSETHAVRIVHNASSQCATTGYSLNDITYIGQNLIPGLAKLMLQLRALQYVVVADIARFYWQVKLDEESQNFTRYLWQFDDEIEMIGSLVLPFGLNSSPYQAIATVHMHCDEFGEQYPLGAKTAKDNLYIDDAFAGDNKRDVVVETVKQLRDLLALAGMSLRKWNSNDKSILVEAGIPRELWATSDEQSYLGLLWNTATDKIRFEFTDILKYNAGCATKRTLISETARVYDVHGIVAPYVLRAKLLFKETWKLGLHWNDRLPEPMNSLWEAWRAEARDGIVISLPRLCAPAKGKKFLAVFCDASNEAFAAVAYVVSESGTSHIVFAKTKVTPMKKPEKEEQSPPLTIARAELLSCVIATRIAVFIKSSFPVGYFYKQCFFTDSLISLYRINSAIGGYKQWVSNRLKEIHKRSAAREWHFVPGLINPADCASRSVTLAELKSNLLWFNGPPFLVMSQENWPPPKALTRAEALEQIGADFSDVEKSETAPVVKYHSAAVATLHAAAPTGLSEVWQNRFERRYETWSQLVRATAYLFKLIRYLLRPKKGGEGASAQTTSASPFERVSNLFSDWEHAVITPVTPAQKSVEWNQIRSYVTVNELRAAEYYWLRAIQRRAYPQCFKASGFDSHDVDNNLFVVKGPYGLLRVKTRLALSETLSAATALPVLLPKGCPLVKLYVLHEHISRGHLAKRTTLSFLRLKCWIQGGRTEVDRILATCRQRICNPPRAIRQQTAPFPTTRLDQFVPFSVVMTDLIGPFKLKHDCLWQDCVHEGAGSKVWAVVFTCFHTRAIALEVMIDMSTASFIKALIKVSSRFGTPKIIYSDNAKTFQSADRKLLKLYSQVDWVNLASEAGRQGIEWRWGTEYAPHANGVVERMCGAAKRALQAAYGRACLTMEDFSVALCECEARINDRPLCPIPESGEMPVTPSQLCIGRLLTRIPHEAVVKTNKPKRYERMMAYRRVLQELFLKRWQNDYLTQLQASRMQKAKNMPQLEVGQVVLVRDKVTKFDKLGTWKQARILVLGRGPDGLVRRVSLKTPRGMIIRHVNDIAVFEGTIPVTDVGDISLRPYSVGDSHDAWKAVRTTPPDGAHGSRKELTKPSESAKVKKAKKQKKVKKIKTKADHIPQPSSKAKDEPPRDRDRPPREGVMTRSEARARGRQQ